MHYQHRVIIDAPLSRVFAYMDDVTREKEWQPAIVEASKEPQGPTAVGTRKRYESEFMGRHIVNTYVTTRFEPDSRVWYETTSDSVLRAKVELQFESTGTGTAVTMAVTGKATGPLRFIPTGILEGVFRKELEDSLRRLKEQLEDVA